MTNKIKVTFVLPEALQNELRDRVIKDGYDAKGKSRWVAESIKHLLSMNAYPDLVKINDEMKGFEKLESVVIVKELKSQLDDAVITVRTKYPAIEGVQSRILRTAIVQRLLQS